LGVSAGVTAHLWSVEEMVALLPDKVTGKKRGPYKNRQQKEDI